MTTAKTVSLAEAQTGLIYQITHNSCSVSTSQKLTLMGLGMGMIIELVALYSHGAVVKTHFGNIAVGSDLIRLITVAST